MGCRAERHQPRACRSRSHRLSFTPSPLPRPPGDPLSQPHLSPPQARPLWAALLTLAASVVIQQDIARGTGAEVGAKLVHTLMLTEELRKAALIHIWEHSNKLHLLFVIPD